MAECIESRKGDCEGEVLRELSTTGATSSDRCRKHRADYLTKMEKVTREVRSRYPDTDTPPAWFDPTYAGERWNEED